MRLLTDYHLHTKNGRFFHGKNSIEEMVYAANSIGLNEIAITDHGFKHLCGTTKEKLKKARVIIDEINTWSSTKVLLGVEADIIAEDGTIDVDNETLAMIDILVVGYHKLIKTDFAGFFGNVPNTKEAKDKCTRAFVNAINRYPVNIVSHIDSVLTTDLYEIGVACRNRGTLIEINNRHTNWTQDQVDELLASGCLFAVSSDAHSREGVGVVDKAFELIKKYDIPSDLIINVEFENSEKSDYQKEEELMFSFYRKKKAEEEAERKKKQETKRIEFTESLSPEMEKALAEIAKEKGLEYVKKGESVPEEKSSSLDNFNFDFMTAEEIEIIKQAQEFLKKHGQELVITPNEKANDESITEELVSENNELQQTDVVEAIVEDTQTDSVVPDDKESNAEMVVADAKEENVEVAEEVTKTPVATEVKTQEKSTEKTRPSTADEILQALAEVKTSQANVKDDTAPKQNIVMTIEKNESKTTKRAISTNAKPKIVDVDVENFVEKPKKESTESKPAKSRKSFGGFMGGTGGFVALSEDNQNKKSTKTDSSKNEN